MLLVGVATKARITRVRMSLGAVQILQKSLEDAQKGLSNTDDEIRRLTGRDPQTRPLYGAKKIVLFRIFVILLDYMLYIYNYIYTCIYPHSILRNTQTRSALDN